MGHKVHPNAFRLGVFRPWEANWFANPKDYTKMLHEDLAMRTAILARLRNAGMLTLTEMAQRLNSCSDTVKDWRDLGLLRAHRYNDRGECLYELPDPALPRKGAWGIRKCRAGEVSSNRAEGVQCEA